MWCKIGGSMMNELIRIDMSNADRPTVLGRDLHEALEVKTAYKDWFPRMCEYGFTEGKDYSSILSNRSDGLPGKPKHDHQLTISMAKELCMIQRNDKGKEFRQYFIKVEEAWNSPEQVMARGLRAANLMLADAQKQVAALEAAREADRPKVLFADAVSASKSSILVGDLAKLLKQNGVDIGQKRLFEWLRENGFLIRQYGASWNMPTQRSMDMGLFEVKETTVTHADGHITISKTPKISGKGQTYFVNRFLDKAAGT